MDPDKETVHKENEWKIGRPGKISLRDIRFDRREWSGSFGDIGTDFPLIVAMILAAGLHTPSVLIVFGAMQIFTGLVYRMPMPVQPLKAMATLVIAQQIGGNILLGAGLAIGVVMLLLSLTGALTWLARWIPKAVIRGIQLGLGISLALLAFKKYIPDEGTTGYILAAISFVLVIFLIDHKRYPASLVVILLGMIYAFCFEVDASALVASAGFDLPVVHLPSIEDVTTGFLLLALPQIPLSLGNSIIATRQVSEDLFPERRPLTVRGIGLTYAFMNLVIPFFSGIPSCHGSGGMVGHYTFGGRTGGSVILYGLFFIVLGVFFGNSFDEVVRVFPLPVLGIILAFEGLALMVLVRDVVDDRRGFVIALLVGILAAGLPYGFVISLVVGTALYYAPAGLEALTGLGMKK